MPKGKGKNKKSDIKHIPKQPKTDFQKRLEKMRYSTALHDEMCSQNIELDYSRNPDAYIR